MGITSLHLHKIDRIVLVLTLIIIFIMFSYAMYYLDKGKDVNAEIQIEDGIMENLTALFFGWAGALFLLAVSSRRLGVKQQLYNHRFFILFLTVVCVFAALEEISFGQRIVGWESPEYFEEQSTQNETDFHNIPAVSMGFAIASGIIFLYGVIVPFGLMYYPHVFQWFTKSWRSRVLYPPIQAAFIFGLGVLAIILDYLMKLITGTRFVANEYQEFFFGYGFLIFSFYLIDKRYLNQITNKLG